MIITVQSEQGYQQFSMDDKTLTWLIDNGYKGFVDGEYILHKLYVSCTSNEQLQRFASCYMTMGFKEAADVHLWDLCRGLTESEVQHERLTQDDYDLIDSILPGAE